jgi:hypothetical protein
MITICIIGIQLSYVHLFIPHRIQRFVLGLCVVLATSVLDDHVRIASASKLLQKLVSL